MNSIRHVNLEPYKSRYTEWLADIEQMAFERAGFDYTRVEPKTDKVVLNIQTGQVLDSINRPIWAMNQIERLILEPDKDLGPIYFSDFYHPGLDALPYSGKEFGMYSFCWAQTFDQYDFTQSMSRWMRPWEVMALELYDLVFVAHEMLAELMCTAVPGISNRVRVVGLPFDSSWIKALCDVADQTTEEFEVVWSSRFDLEKVPQMFLDLVEMRPDWRFVICTGHPALIGNDKTQVNRALEYSRTRKNLVLRTGLTKSAYYNILVRSKVQFNSALQDWVSFTLLEALTFGCTPMYPNSRSFPSVLDYDQRYLYRPLDVVEAAQKIEYVLEHPMQSATRGRILEPHENALTTLANEIKKDYYGTP